MSYNSYDPQTRILATTQEVKHFQGHLPKGSWYSVTGWGLLLIPASLLWLVGSTWRLIFPDDPRAWMLQGLAIIAWQTFRVSVSMNRIKRALAKVAHADLVKTLSGDINPSAHHQIQQQSYAKAKVQLNNMALYIRKINPEFLGPQWQTPPESWPT